MKKIGIMTFHYVDNYGAVIQAWALKKILLSYFDCEAEIINYVPEGYKIMPYDMSKEGILQMKRKRNEYEKFLADKCSINSDIIHKVEGNNYEIYCVGSDQVWNMRLRETKDQEYLFPNLSESARRFSYATSLGGKMKKEYIEAFKNTLSLFDKVSIRESSSIDEIKELVNDRIEVTLDPALLLNSDDYSELIEEPDFPCENYIFFFTYPIGEAIRKIIPFVNMMANKTGMKVIHSCVNEPEYTVVNNAGMMMYEGIGQFLWYIKNASIVVTTSYHCMILASLFGKQTYVYNVNNGKERFEELEDVLGMRDNMVDDDWLIKQWDFSYGNKINKYELQNRKKKSLDFLKKAIEK